LALHLPDGRPPLEARGLIARAPEDGLRGIRFEALSDGDRRRLHRFIFKGQWEAIRASVTPRPRARRPGQARRALGRR
jgi:hypothetical protein